MTSPKDDNNPLDDHDIPKRNDLNLDLTTGEYFTGDDPARDHDHDPVEEIEEYDHSLADEIADADEDADKTDHLDSLDDLEEEKSVPVKDDDDPVSRLQSKLTSDDYVPENEETSSPTDNTGDVTGSHPSGFGSSFDTGRTQSDSFPSYSATGDYGIFHTDPYPTAVPEHYANAQVHGNNPAGYGPGAPMNQVQPYGHGGNGGHGGYGNQVQAYGDQEDGRKSMLVAFLLAFLGGTLGIHNFYLGYTGRAITQLTLTIIGLLTAIILIGFIFLAVTGVWALVDWIMIIADKNYKDADGRTLKRE